MADNPAEQLNKKITLAIETALRGVKESVAALEQMSDVLKEVNVSSEAVEKATADLSKSYKKASKDVSNLSKNFTGLKKIQKSTYEITRRVGNIAKTSFAAASTAAAAFAVEAYRIGDAMLRFQTTSLDAANAINRLSSAYGGLSKQSNTAVLSMQDIAAEITKFQSQGIAQMSATMNEQFLEGWRGLQGAMTRVLGKGNAGELMSAFVQSMGDEFKILRSTISGDLNRITKDIEKAVDPQVKAEYIQDAIDRIRELRLYTSDQGTAAQQVIGTLTKFREAVLGGGDDFTRAVVSMNVAWAQLGTKLENFSTELVKTLGPDLAQLIDEVGGRLQNDMGNVIKWIAKEARDLKARFDAWGGIDKLIDSIQRGLDGVYSILQSIIKAAKWAAEVFIEANSAGKILYGTLAVMALNPSLIPSVIMLGKGLKDVAMWGAQAATAAKGMQGFGAAAKGFAGRAAGIGVGIAAAGAGYTGARLVAQTAGAEKHGYIDTASGALGAAAGGALAGAAFGPIGAAVGAGMAAVGSIIVGSVHSYQDRVAEAVKSQKDYNNEVLVSSIKAVKVLQDQIKQIEPIAVTEARKVELAGKQNLLAREMLSQRVLRGEITDIEAQPALDMLDKQLNDLIGKKRELGLYDSKTTKVALEYVTKMEKAEAQRSKLLAQSNALQGDAQSKLVKQAEKYNETIQKLKEAGKIQTEINGLLRERQEILNMQRAGNLSEEKAAQAAGALTAKVDALKDEQIELTIIADPGEHITKITNQLRDLQKMQLIPDFDFNSEDYLGKLREVAKEYNRFKSASSEVPSDVFKDQIDELDKLMDRIRAGSDEFGLFISKLEDLKAASARTLPGFTGTISSLLDVMSALGPTTEMFGEQMAKVVGDISLREMTHGFEVLAESSRLAAIAQQEIANANTAEDATRWTIQLGKAMEVAAQATKALEQSLEAALQPLQKQVDLIQSIKDLRQLDLDISQQLYGTPALAVQAQLELVKTIQAEKETMEAQLAIVNDRIARAKELGLTEQDIYKFQMDRLELSKKIKGLTRDQLQQIKQLRDGYLDAVQAQALGAGRFSKILFTQDQNAMRGMQKEAIKKNFLLGQIAEEAASSRADAYRFSAQGMGYLESLSGQAMQPQDIARAVYERVSNISDPLAKASAMQSADIWMNIMNGADKNTRDLGSIFMTGMQNLGDRFVDAINQYAEERFPRAAAGLALKDSAAGETFKGSLSEKQLSQINNNQLKQVAALNDSRRDADYIKQAQKQGASLDSIQALLQYRHGKPVDAVLSGQEDAVEAPRVHKFFDQAISYYRDMVGLLRVMAGESVSDELGNYYQTFQNYLSSIIRAVSPAPAETVPFRFKSELPSGLAAGPPNERIISDLRKTDTEVKRHERAHARVAGPHATGRPTYTYKEGPDGRKYAVGGEVMVDLSPIPGDPIATMEKMQRIRKAALAPRHPSKQDMAIAQKTAQIENQIRGALGFPAMQQGSPPIWLPRQATQDMKAVFKSVPLVDVPKVSSASYARFQAIAPETSKSYTPILDGILQFGSLFKAVTSSIKILPRELDAANKSVSQFGESVSDAQVRSQTTPHPNLAKLPAFVAEDIGTPKTEDYEKRMRRMYGDYADFLIRTEKGIKDLDSKIRQIDVEIDSPVKIPQPKRGPFGVAPKDLHGFEIPGVESLKSPAAKQVQKPIERKPATPKKELERRREAIKKVREKEAAKLEKVRKKAEESSSKVMSQEMFDATARKEQAAAQDAMGLSYSGEAPQRIPLMQVPVAAVIPQMGPPSPDQVRPEEPKVPMSYQRVGVPDPTRIRQLSHSGSGNAQAIAKNIVSQLLRAGQGVQQIASLVDAQNEERDNITQYAGNRLNSVQSLTP